MQKARLKVFVKKRIRPLFVVDIYNDVEKTIEDFKKDLNDNSKFTVEFGQVCFNRQLFRYLEVKYK